MKVAIQGERGAFSHQAALQLVRGAEVLACATSVQVFDALDSRQAAAAVIPVENTLAGPVGEHLDLLWSATFLFMPKCICGSLTT